MANLLIDMCVIVLSQFCVGLVYGVLALSGRGHIGQTHADIAVGYALDVLVFLGYYISCEGATGCTVGKLVTRTRVRTTAGGRAGLGTIVGRTVARLIPFEAFTYLGDGCGWHDELSGTRVLRIVRRPVAATVSSTQAEMDERERELMKRLGGR
ncbi:MAG: RDD family protein [Armatimonadetes bacterium]|nr:RDD family protein [Armatimonadota bacterium]